MKRRLIFAAMLVAIVELVSCQSTNDVPPSVTSNMAGTGNGQHLDLVTLRAGRTIFVSRCIECHTLPRVSRYRAVEWPKLVDEMAGRASLKPAERNALLAYLVAARTE